MNSSKPDVEMSSLWDEETKGFLIDISVNNTHTPHKVVEMDDILPAMSKMLHVSALPEELRDTMESVCHFLAHSTANTLNAIYTREQTKPWADNVRNKIVLADGFITLSFLLNSKGM